MDFPGGPRSRLSRAYGVEADPARMRRARARVPRRAYYALQAMARGASIKARCTALTIPTWA